MKKRLLAAAVAGAVMLSAGAQAQDTAAPEGYQLQQVLIMSRHNLRAPLANNGSVREQSTAKAWPQWDVPGGQLTTKGGVLEVYMGHYMREWLAQRQIKAENLTQLTAFRHTFSHFHLDIVPMWLTVHSSGACMDEGNALGYNLAQPPSVGLAAPVERLLQQLKAGTPV